MKKIIRLLPMAAAMLLVMSCSKKAKEPVVNTTEGPGAYTEIVDKVNANRNTAEQVTCRMSMDLEAGKQKLSVGGNLKMKRNDVIQMSLQVFGFVEAGRLEMTQDYILILNRIGKQYVKASYKDIPYFKENGINFFTFQSLLWNELFVPGSDDTRPNTANFTQTKSGKDIVLTNTTKQMVTRFFTNATTNLLEQTNIEGTNGGNINWEYASWARLSGKDFPDKMNIKMNIRNTAVKAGLQLTRLRADEKWKDTRTSIDKKKLKQVSLQSAFSQIMSLSN